MIQLELPYPPSINHHFSYVRGRPVLSKEARAYRSVVRRTVIASGMRPLLGELAVHIKLHPPDRRRRDADNAQKSILDALQRGGAFLDDSQVVWLLTEKLEPVPDGQTLVVMGEADRFEQRSKGSDCKK